jgi:large subunit ribosomal protein L24
MVKETASPKIHVKKGDSVVVISGKDAGKRGKIINVDAKRGRIYVDKINLVSRHTKPTQGAPQGGIIKKEAAMHSSNVMLFCSKCGKGVRVAKEILPDGQKVRVCFKCGAHFDK